MKRKKATIQQIRKAVADYMRSEGCSCCQSSQHPANAARLGRLLNVPKHEDGSGYDFAKFRSKT